MEQITFHHTLPIQLRFNDVDKFGHINNTVYLTYYDLGKLEYFSESCPAINAEEYGIIIAHIEIDFLSQILASSTIAVQTAVTEIGHKSMTLVQQVIDRNSNEVKCYCKSVIVAFDLATHETVAIPEEWKDSICVYEQKELRRPKVLRAAP
jgi:acyl-CoA thioester hydrolase